MLINRYFNDNFESKYFWLFISLLIKVVLYYIFIFPNIDKYPHVGPFLLIYDWNEHILPIDNLIDKGVYSIDGINPYAGRLPGFFILYAPIRFLFNSKISNLILGIILVALGLIRSYLLAKIAYILCDKSKFAFLISFFLAEVFPFTFQADWLNNPYSLCSSILIISSYVLLNMKMYDFKVKYFLFSVVGFGVTWCFFLRPYNFPFLLIFCGYMVYEMLKNKMEIKRIFLSSLFYVIPFLIGETIWIIRNYYAFHQFIPLQTSFVPFSYSKNSEYGRFSKTKYSMIKLRELIHCWGGDNFWYYPNSDMGWFLGEHNNATIFSNYIFFDGFTIDSFLVLKNDILNSFDNKLTVEESEILEQRIIERCERFKKMFMKEKTAYYLFVAPFKRIKNYLLRNPVQDIITKPFKESSLLEYVIKLISILEYFILILSIPFQILFYSLKKIKMKSFIALLLCLILSNILLFMFFINAAYLHYFQSHYYLLIITFTFFSYKFTNNFFTNNFWNDKSY